MDWRTNLEGVIQGKLFSKIEKLEALENKKLVDNNATIKNKKNQSTTMHIHSSVNGAFI